MGYYVLGKRDERWQPREGLEGPFFYPNGKVAYYDPKEGQYYDPLTDFYLTQEEADALNNMVFDLFRG